MLLAGQAGLLGGCDSELAPGRGDLLCPGCVPRSGGETTDFGGGSECHFEEQAIPDDRELRAQLQTTLAAYAGDFVRTLRWSASDWAIEPEETTVRGNVEFGGGSYFVGDQVECGDFIQVPASIELETADGGLKATSEGTLTLRPADGTSAITGVTDLSKARGTLDLRIDSSEPHVGRLSTVIGDSADGLRGTVAIEVSYFADPDSAEAYARGDQVESISEFTVVGGFPAE